MAKSRLCSIPDCGKPVDSHGYCGAHAQRLRRHGDPLGGGTSHHEPRRFLDSVVISHHGSDCLIWPFARDLQGYAKIHVGKKNKLVSRLVCERTHGLAPSPSHEVAHSCGRGMSGCVSPDHVGWKTHIENEADKLLHGTHQFGEQNPRAKLTASNVSEIRQLRGQETQRVIAMRFGISQSLVSLIQTKKLWPEMQH